MGVWLASDDGQIFTTAIAGKPGSHRFASAWLGTSMNLAKFPWGHSPPALERAMKRPGLGKPQVLRDILNRQGAIEQVMLRQLLAQVIEDLYA